MSEPAIQEILPSDIVFNAGTQARVQTDTKTVQAYAESMKDGVKFPPIDVFNDDSSNLCILADGFHRYTAHNSLFPNEPILCKVHLGDVEDAKLFAACANQTHGLRRTSEDKRKAVKIIFQLSKVGNWSNVKIANEMGVSEFLVRSVRCELEKLTSIKSKSALRTGADGRTINVSKIGRTYKFDEPPEPETHIRTNADGKTVNVRGYDFKAHRRCEECMKWNPQNGFCERDEQRQPSWAPACDDFVRRESTIPEDKPIQVDILSTRPHSEPKRKHRQHAPHIIEKHISCKLYPKNPELTAVEIRHILGNEFLLSLSKAIETITKED